MKILTGYENNFDLLTFSLTKFYLETTLLYIAKISSSSSLPFLINMCFQTVKFTHCSVLFYRLSEAQEHHQYREQFNHPFEFPHVFFYPILCPQPWQSQICLWSLSFVPFPESHMKEIKNCVPFWVFFISFFLTLLFISYLLRLYRS